MKVRRHEIFLAFVLALIAGSLLMAQKNPYTGTWKLNLTKSKYEPDPPPRSQTRTCTASGIQTVKGIGAIGNPILYSYPIKGDGKVYPIKGEVPNGGDKISSKRISARTYEANFTKAGKRTETAVFVLSQDGKVLTISAKGILPANGEPFTHLLVWDKQ